jgi:hypothetical protein
MGAVMWGNRRRALRVVPSLFALEAAMLISFETVNAPGRPRYSARHLRAGKPKPRWQFRQKLANGECGPWKSCRAFYRASGLGVADARLGVDGWQWREYPAKGKYVMFVGDKRERREMLRALRYSVVPYVKWDL